MSKHNKGNGIQIETENATTWILNKAFIPTGRIKRMRNPIPKHRWPTLTKRIGCQRTFLITIFPNDVFTKALFGITRWNRH